MTEPATDAVPPGELWSIGHDGLSIERFMDLMRQHSIAVVADIRKVPYYAEQPQFNREALARGLQAAGVMYVFLGRELGSLPMDSTLWRPHGGPNYEAFMSTPLYQAGLARLMELAAQQRTVVLSIWSEGDPTRYFRGHVLARRLLGAGWQIHHISITPTVFIVG